MRQLKPEVVTQRKRDLLQWMIHYFIRTSKPVSSSAIAEESNFDLSSATIRNILQELEEEGFLYQPHSSSGRTPTDKAYRFYVDYLSTVQRLASGEKEKIERQYRSHIEELDTLLAGTSKLLSSVSQGAGLVLSPRLKGQLVKRFELVALGGRKLLGLVVTESGFVRHWPVELPFEPTSRQIAFLNRFLNDNVQGASLGEAKKLVMESLKNLEAEFKQMGVLAEQLIGEIGRIASSESLYVDGADNIVGRADDIGDFKTVQALMRTITERHTIAALLEQEITRQSGAAQSGKVGKTHVSIGRESGVPELAGVSLITATFKHNEKIIGVLGILGPKRMEYPRMISLVDYMSGLLSRKLESWGIRE